MACTCKVGPGQFEGEPALVFMAHEQMCMGMSDDSIGRYDFFKAPFNFDADSEVVKAALAYGYCQECVDGYDDKDAYGMVIWTRDDGFACGNVYYSEKKYNEAVEDAEEE